MSDEIEIPLSAPKPQSLQPVPTDELRKEIRDKARELTAAAQDLEQASFQMEVPTEPAFFMDEEKVRKTYTAAQADKILMRKRTCIYLLAQNAPIEDIMDLLEMNFRTVKAIAAQNGEAVAVQTKKFAARLRQSAAADLAVAETMRDKTGAKDLAIIAGIKMTHAGQMDQTAPEESDVIEVGSAESEQLKKFREGLRKMKPAEGRDGPLDRPGKGGSL